MLFHGRCNGDFKGSPSLSWETASSMASDIYAGCKSSLSRHQCTCEGLRLESRVGYQGLHVLIDRHRIRDPGDGDFPRQNHSTDHHQNSRWVNQTQRCLVKSSPANLHTRYVDCIPLHVFRRDPRDIATPPGSDRSSACGIASYNAEWTKRNTRSRNDGAWTHTACFPPGRAARLTPSTHFRIAESYGGRHAQDP